MKIRIYAPLLISVGLALASSTVDARTSHLAIKKYASHASKRVKAHSRKTSSHHAFGRKKHTLSTASYKNGPDESADEQDATAYDSPNETESTRISTTLYPQANGSLPFPPISQRRIGQIDSESPSNTFSAGDTAHHGYLQSAKPLEYSSLTGAFGVIETNLAEAGEKAGLSEDLIEELTQIFAWDIDFASNLHPGDQFTVLYKNVSEPDGTNERHIYAAEFVSQGKFLTAVRYDAADGHISYYTPEGNSLQKAFLSTPVDYARISSHFDTHRRHPVLNRIRAHKGVDYAARTGTPVKAAGDGEVIFKGRKGGYGQVLILKHGDRYETLYAHLSGFKHDLNDGDHVMQGQVIGYVGQTGLATGPHLHYEFRIDGVHQNPESQEFKRPMRLTTPQLAEFKDKTKPLLAKLYQTKSRNMLARNQ